MARQSPGDVATREAECKLNYTGRDRQVWICKKHGPLHMGFFVRIFTYANGVPFSPPPERARHTVFAFEKEKQSLDRLSGRQVSIRHRGLVELSRKITSCFLARRLGSGDGGICCRWREFGYSSVSVKANPLSHRLSRVRVSFASAQNHK
ncbi:hypothetical protein EYF80_026126 [Liparis tanakae]|uniref:Uncharacterized protein n=1 Tax=Liparis tanakae TaxID=230148 RepID=A0A4Z2HDI5_9TELE|nr:hypothetical protein EYF80_026126 [Liparis tanakae]